MSTDTTGPALATDHLSHTVLVLRDACAPPRRRGWRAAVAGAAGVDAVRLAITALLDALLLLIQEFTAARGRPDALAAALVSRATEAVGGDVFLHDGDDTDDAGLPCASAPAPVTSNAPRARRASATGAAHLPIPVIAITPLAPARRRSAVGPSLRASRRHAAATRGRPPRSSCRPAARTRCILSQAAHHFITS